MTMPSEDAAVGAGHGGMPAPAPPVTTGSIDPFLRALALSMVAAAFSFLINKYLVFWLNWPELGSLFAHYGLKNGTGKVLTGTRFIMAWIQLLVFLVPIVAVTVWAFGTRQRTLHADSEVLSNISAFIARGAFWSVVFVGLADAVISFLRVEDLLAAVVGDNMTQELGRASYRGVWVHYPLIVLGFVVASFTRSVGFIWLALLVVVAELQIVILRFIFSYEQAFMGDLVRFWYGGLFLFASAYTLFHEGHVRVDLLYTNLSERGKAWSNAIGSIVLGAPVCWVILERGMSDRSNVILSPLLNYEVTQSGFGMYVKYLMAGFLAVYAISMLIQFMSYFLNSVGILLKEPDAHVAPVEEAHF